MNALADTTSSPRRGFKIPVPVFAAVIAILAILAGWYVYDRVFRVQDIDPSQYESLYTPSARARDRFVQRMERPGPANAGIGVLKRDNGFDVQIPGARARFSSENDKLQLNIRFIDNALFNRSDRDATIARFVALREPDAAAGAKVTPEQVEKLKQINVPREMLIPDDARQKLTDFAQRYTAAPADQQSAIETEMTEYLRTVAAAALQPTVADYARSAREIREVLTSDQIDTLRNASR